MKLLTIFKAEMAAKYGAPVYSRHPPITAIFPDTDQFQHRKANIRNPKKLETLKFELDSSPITQLKYIEEEKHKTQQELRREEGDF